LEIGKGSDGFHAIDEGGRTLTLVHGAQGGFHVDLALQARAMDASEPWEGTLVGTVEGETRGEEHPYLDMRCNGPENALQVWGVRLVWDVEDPAEMDDVLVDIEVSVLDAAGTEAATRVEDVMVEDPEL
jgi:hypothetical protein